MISKIRYYVNDLCLLNLFYSFIQSHVNYNLINWSSTYPTYLNQIDLKIKSAVRLISFKNKYEHSKPLFLKHNILPLDELIKHKKANFLWKICHGYIKKPLSQYFTQNIRNPLRFNLPNPNSDMEKSQNSIPLNIRNASTLNSFNEKHKKHLFSTLSIVVSNEQGLGHHH